MFQKRTVRWSAAAAVAALIVGSAWLMVGISPRPAYAFSQTLEAMQRVYRVHMIGRDWDDKRVELWLEMDPETSQTSRFRIDEKDAKRLTVGTSAKVYYFDGNNKTVRIVEGDALEMGFRWGHLQEDMAEWAGSCGSSIEYSNTVDPSGQDLYVAKFAIKGVQIEAVVDPRTMLPVRYRFNAQPGQRLPVPLKDVESITYPDEFATELFAFTVPTDARILTGSSGTGRGLTDEMLAGGLIQHAVGVHKQTHKTLGGSGNLPVNTRIFVVDGEMNVRWGSILRAANYTNQPITGEIALGTFYDAGAVSLFDEAGVPQRKRVTMTSPKNRLFQLYWVLDNPLPPKETRYLFLAYDKTWPLRPNASDQSYSLEMDNHFGSEVLENFLLIVPTGVRLIETSEPPQSRTTIGSYDVVLWSKHNPRDTTNTVTVALTPANR